MKPLTTSIKIFVSCHKECEVLDDDYIYPIQVGTAISQLIFSECCHDNDGEANISDKNRSYCEVTSQYWAWKNTQAEYYGFFHYRRYLSMLEKPDDKHCGTKGNSGYSTVQNLQELKNKYGFDHDHMTEFINKYDVIAPFLDSSIPCSNYDLYANHHYIKDLDYVLNVLKEKYPYMYDGALEYIHRKSGYYCNMFIMKKDIFNQYCNWLFSILNEFEGNVNIDNYDTVQYRVHGYLAERLCGVYLNWLKMSKQVSFKEVQIVNIIDTNQTTVKKIFEKTDCALVVAANDFYAPYLSTLIQSIIENRSETKTYDIIILSTDISKETAEKFCYQIKNLNDFSIRIFDVSNYMKNYEKLPVHGHFKIETYYRFFIQDIMVDYDKALYLDSDMVVNTDIADLYSIDLGDNALAACYDVDTAGLYNGFEPGKKHYMDDILNIRKPFEYFQAGTILFNLKKIRLKNNVESNLRFAMSRDWELLDQDVLNYVYQGDVLLLDPFWNYMVNMYGFRISKIISLAPDNLKKMYMRARLNPGIIHYAGPEKPWESLNMDFADYYWKYAKKTPFYEDMLIRLRKKLD